MNIYALIAFINSITSLFLGIFVYFNNKNKPENRSFLWLCLDVSFWSFSYFLWQISNTRDSALFWCRVLMVGAVLIPILYFHFITTLLNIVKKNRNFLRLGYFVSLFFILFNFTPLMVNGVDTKLSFQFWPNAGYLYLPFLLFWFFYAVYAVYLLRDTKKVFVGVKKNQLRYVLMATIIGYLGGITNYFLWYDIPIPPIGNFTTTIFMSLIAYAILRYRFMDIRVVIRKTFVYGFSVAVAGVLGVVLVGAVNRFLGQPIEGIILLINAVGILLAIGVFIPLRAFFENLANKYFFATLYNEQRKMEEVIQELPKKLYLGDIVDLIHKTIDETFHIEKFVILAREQDKEDFTILKQTENCQLDVCTKIDFDVALALQKFKKPILAQEVDVLPLKPEEKANLKKSISLIGIAVALPLISKGDVFGTILLGEKFSGDAYSVQDIHLLENLANHASITIENALLFRRVQRFADELQVKVDKATKNLRAANSKLKQLDEAKSEFLRIVSHQLRTPMTALRWYSKALMEGQYGELNKEQQDSVNDIYQGTIRQIKLIGSFLDVAHVEVGKITLHKEKCRVETIIQEVIDMLKVFADKTGLYLKFEQPKNPLPEFELDRDKITEITRNLVDNAIKYTNKGGIAVEVDYNQKKKEIQITVKDTGVGFSKTDKTKLFGKFSRLKNGQSYPWGSGLGLYVCKKLIESHGGKIWADSPGVNQGSTFAFTIPVA